MEILWKRAVFAEIWEPKSLHFQQSFHTRILGEILEFYAFVLLQIFYCHNLIILALTRHILF